MSWIQIWKKSKKRYNWNYIERACEEIACDVAELGIVRVIGLSRGGLIPATIIANKLCVREVLSIGVASYELGYDGIETAGKIHTYQRLPVNCPVMNKGESMLIVDDISDKGNTFKHVLDSVTAQYRTNFYTASIFMKPDTCFKPDYHYKSVPNDQWVIFPWET